MVSYPYPELFIKQQDTTVLNAMNAMAEDEKNPLAIMCVVRNRVCHPNRNLFYSRYRDSNDEWQWTYPDNPIKGVIMKTWAFSWIWAMDTNTVADRNRVLNIKNGKLEEKSLWDNVIYPMSQSLIAGTLPNDITSGSTHYFEIGTDIPSWASQFIPTVIIGHQQYYKLP